jgi:hypothetical protein
VGPGQPELVAQEVDEQQPRLDVARVLCPLIETVTCIPRSR